MNPILEKFASECETTYVDRDGAPYIEFDKEKFAQLIIAECMKDPRVYLLNKLNLNNEAGWDLHGWTSDIVVAKAWRASTNPRSESRDFTSISFVKRIVEIV